MIRRSALLACLIVSAGMYGRHAAGTEASVSREALAALPRQIDGWRAEADVPLDDEVLNVLGVDDYVNRTYATPGMPPVSLYIAYYASQRQGDTIHSPQNCLPGAGWLPVEGGRTSVDVRTSRLTVNRYVIQKGIDRQLVLYWYQGRGRVVANEYANKLWLMFGAARLHRTNGSLVRLIAPA